MRKNFFAAFVFVAALVVSSACDMLNGGSGPTGPSPNPEPVTISPTSAKVGPGGEQMFVASGGDGQNYNWSVIPADGGSVTFNSGFPNRGFFRANGNLGNYAVEVSSGGNSAQARVEVVRENWLELVSVSVPSGGTMRYEVPISFKVRYVTGQELTKLSVQFLGPGGEFVSTGGTDFPKYLGISDELTVKLWANDNNASQTEVSFVEFEMYGNAPGGGLITYATFRFPYELHFRAGP